MSLVLANGEVVSNETTQMEIKAPPQLQENNKMNGKDSPNTMQVNGTVHIKIEGEKENNYHEDTTNHNNGKPLNKHDTPPKPNINGKTFLHIKNSHKKGTKTKKASDESSDSDEESFARDLKDRKVLEALERASNIEIREKVDQERINRSFFKLPRNPEWKEHQAAMQTLCETDLFHPPPPPPGFNPDECEGIESSNPSSLSSSSSSVHVPRFSLVNDYIPYNQQYSNKFNDQYKSGYINFNDDDHHHELASPREKGENGKGRGRDLTLTPDNNNNYKGSFSKKVADIFNPTEWCVEEVRMFEELLHIHGPHFEEISRLMCNSKSSSHITSFFIDKWITNNSNSNTNNNNNNNDNNNNNTTSLSTTGKATPEVKRKMTCHVCFQSPGDPNLPPKKGPKAKLIVCGGCDRAYHLMCLTPRPSSTTDPWFCSDECVNMSLLQCQLCGNAENDEKMLLCDSCDKGYHIFCLVPPLEKIPDGDWNCTRCSAPPPSSSSSSSSILQSQSPSHDDAPYVCTHSPFQFIKSINSGENPQAFEAPNTSFLDPNPPVVLPNDANKCHPLSTRSLSAPAIFATTPDKLTNKVEPTDLITTQTIESLSSSPPDNDFTEIRTETIKGEDLNSSDSIKTEPSDSFIPPPPPPPQKLTRSKVKTSPSSTPTKPTFTKSIKPPKLTKLTKSMKSTPPQSPRQAPSLSRTLSSIQSLATPNLPMFEEHIGDGEDGEDEGMQLDANTIASSALPHSLLAIKHWGKHVCLECLLRTGLLPGDTIFSKRNTINPSGELGDYQSIFAHPLISHKFNYKATTLTKHFDAILAAVNIATQLVIDGKTDSNNHAHILSPSDTPNHVPSPSTSNSKKRGACDANDSPNKLARVGSPSNIPSTLSQTSPGNQWWLFTFNPRIREITTLIPQAQLEWQLRQNMEKIKEGDRVYVWVNGRQAGIYALGTIAKDPFSPSDSSIIDRTLVRIDEILSSPISKDIIEQDSDMCSLPFVRGPPGHFNYLIIPSFVEKLSKLISPKSLSPKSPLSLSGSISKSPSLSLASNTSDIPHPLHKDENGKNNAESELNDSKDRSQPVALSPSSIPPSPSPSLTLSNQTSPTIPSNNDNHVNTTLFLSVQTSNSIHISLSSPSTPLPVKSPLISPTTHPPSSTALIFPSSSLPVSPSISPTLFLGVSPVPHKPSTTITSSSSSSFSTSTSASTSRSISPSLSTSHSTPHTCDVCKRTENNVKLQCLGCKDWYHPSCTTAPTGTLSLLPWYCPPCSSLNQQNRSCTACALPGNATTLPLLVCDSCAQSYHFACVVNGDSPLPFVPRCWLCSPCMPSLFERVNAVLLIGWREIRNECNRILSSECEFTHDAYRKAILTSSKAPNRVYQQMHELTNSLSDLRRGVVSLAQSRYSEWAKAQNLGLYFCFGY